MRRIISCTLILFLALQYDPIAGAGTALPSEKDSQSVGVTRPNVVLVIVDTLRGDMLFGQGNGVPVMPKLAVLAHDSRTFTAAACPCSWTRPSMVSLFTGQHVDGHRVYFGCGPDGVVASNTDFFPDGWHTLAEALANAGYTNYAFVTNPNVAPGLGMEQGFPPENYLYEVNAPAARVTGAAIERAVSLPEPFFMYLHYMDPHVPYNPPPEHSEVFGKLPPLTDTDCNALLPDIQIHYLIDSFQCSLDPARVPQFEPLSDGGKNAMRMHYWGDCQYAWRIW